MNNVEKSDTLEALLEANLKLHDKLKSDQDYLVKGSELKELITTACMLAMVAIERERNEKNG